METVFESGRMNGAEFSWRKEERKIGFEMCSMGKVKRKCK